MSRLQSWITWVRDVFTVDVDLSDLNLTDDDIMQDLEYGQDNVRGGSESSESESEDSSIPPPPPPPPPPPGGWKSDGPPPPPPPMPMKGGAPSKKGGMLPTANKSAAVRDEEAMERTRQKFTPLKEPVGKGIWKIQAVMNYTPSGPTEVPGTKFSDVCPGQDHVNRKIVEMKLEAGLPASPIIPAVIAPDGKITLSDKHHTFAACMAIGRGVKLALTGVPLASTGQDRGDWTACTWKGFEKPGQAAKGFSIDPNDAKKLEGEKVKEAEWKKIVPWRKDAPSTDEAYGQEVTKSIGELFDPEELGKSFKSDPKLATKLFDLMKVDGVKIEFRTPDENSTGGDWDPYANTIYIDDTLGTDAAVDMLVFEAHNALHQSEYSVLQHEAYQKGMPLEEFGEKKAKIEAGVTIEYVEHLLSRLKKGEKLAPMGEKALASIEKKISGYRDLSETERKEKYDELVELIISTPHGGEDVKLPNRGALSTADLYAFERAADNQGVKGIVASLEKKIPALTAKKKEFIEALKKVKPTAEAPKKGEDDIAAPGAGWFYHLASTAANELFNLKLTEFNASQQKVAEHEYKEAGCNWGPTLISDLKKLKPTTEEESTEGETTED